MQRPLDIKNRPRIPIPDEDPYSIAGNGSGGSSGSSGFGTSNNVSGVYKICIYRVNPIKSNVMEYTLSDVAIQ